METIVSVLSFLISACSALVTPPRAVVDIGLQHSLAHGLITDTDLPGNCR